VRAKNSPQPDSARGKAPLVQGVHESVRASALRGGEQLLGVAAVKAMVIERP
jgi:hypothetical protein